MGEKTRKVNMWLAPYPPPADRSVKRVTISNGLVSLFIFSFLLFFRPLDLPTDYSLSTILFILGFAFITFAICIMYFVIIPNLWEKPFRSSSWTLIKSISYSAILIFTIALGNLVFINLYQGSLQMDIKDIFFFILGTFVIGVIPASFLTALDFQKSKIRYQREGAVLSKDIVKSNGESQELRFQSNYGEEDVVVAVSDLLFVEAEGNYITIYSKVQPKRMLRNSLKSVCEIIEKEDRILKTHRSFVVNLSNVSAISGNAQGFTLEFEGFEYVAKVSRANTKEVKKLISQLG